MKPICSEKELNRYYPAKCQKCWWVGSSSKVNGGGPLGDSGDYDDIYCPRCDSWEVDEYHCNYFPWYQFIFDFIWLVYGNPKHKRQLKREEEYWERVAKEWEDNL
jgi:hypothetical protein